MSREKEDDRVSAVHSVWKGEPIHCLEGAAFNRNHSMPNQAYRRGISELRIDIIRFIIEGVEITDLSYARNNTLYNALSLYANNSAHKSSIQRDDEHQIRSGFSIGVVGLPKQN